MTRRSATSLAALGSTATLVVAEDVAHEQAGAIIRFDMRSLVGWHRVRVDGSPLPFR